MNKQETPEKVPVLKQLSTNVGYIVGIIGFAGIVWTMASKTANKDFSVANLRKDVIEVKQAVDRVEEKVDTLSIHHNKIDKKQNELVFLIEGIKENQEVLKSSFATHLRADKRYEELVQFLESYKFDIEKVLQDTMQYKIRVKKIEK